MRDTHEQVIADTTGQQPFVFMVMGFGQEYAFYREIQRIVEQEVNVPCIRADHVPGSGSELVRKIHALIENAALVIADISISSPNVFYEIGYAYAKRKTPLLIKREGAETPTDLQGFEVLVYGGDRGPTDQFEARLREHVRVRLASPNRLLREMLMAPAPHPSLIVAQAKLPPPNSPATRLERQTFGDNLGILGLIKAFGALTRSEDGLELLAAMHCDQGLLEVDANLYCIGSPKTNPVSGWVMDHLQQGRGVQWEFRNVDGDGHTGVDRETQLVRAGGGLPWPLESRREARGDRVLWVEDYGVIIRGPHPTQPNRLVMVLAGAHSLGTGAACLAATRSSLLEEVAHKLGSETLADPEARFWVLLSTRFDPPKPLLPTDVEIIDARRY